MGIWKLRGKNYKHKCKRCKKSFQPDKSYGHVHICPKCRKPRGGKK